MLDSRFGLDQGFASYDDAIPARADGAKVHFDERPAGSVVDAALAAYEKFLDADGKRPSSSGPISSTTHFPTTLPGRIRRRG
ncbi:MAG: hypothetical protein R3F20_01605 [Planctomycetota bacterium]